MEDNELTRRERRGGGEEKENKGDKGRLDEGILM